MVKKKIEDEFVDEDVEIKKLFKGFKKQIEELRSKKTNLEAGLNNVKNDLMALQDEEYKTLQNLQKLLKSSTDLNKKRAQVETELSLIEDKLIKLTKIARI